MSNNSLMILNAHVFTAREDYFADIFIESGQIRAVGKKLSEKFIASQVIDADGLYVLPGCIDAHTHMELSFMGTSSSDDFASGTLAGLFGGTTSIIDFAMQEPKNSLSACVAQWHEKAHGKAVCDYSF